MIRRTHVAVGLMLAVACNDAPKNAAPNAPVAVAPQAVEITAAEFTFAAPDTIAPGMTTFRFVNNGQQEHHVILARLDSGKTVADLQAEMAKNPNGEPAWLTFHGAASGVVAGGSANSTINLPEGRYVLLCFIPDQADGTPHVMKGMMREMIVTGTPNAAPAPTAVADIHMLDFTYELPVIAAGTSTFRVVNDGPSTHEVQLIRLADGATVESLGASMAPGYKGPSQGTSMGGPGAISKGLEQWWTTTLEPGNYVVTCFVPDSTGKPHLVLGMMKPFTVAAAGT